MQYQYNKENGNLVVHPQLPWLAATPDYFIKAKSNANGATNHLLEIKTTSRDIPEVCPKHVQQQVVTQLFVIKSAMPDFFNGDTWAAVVFKSTTDKKANAVVNDVEDDHMATLKGHIYLPSTKQVEAVLDTTPGKSRILTLSEDGKTVRKRSLLAAIPI